MALVKRVLIDIRISINKDQKSRGIKAKCIVYCTTKHFNANHMLKTKKEKNTSSFRNILFKISLMTNKHLIELIRN